MKQHYDFSLTAWEKWTDNKPQLRQDQTGRAGHGRSEEAPIGEEPMQGSKDEEGGDGIT